MARIGIYVPKFQRVGSESKLTEIDPVIFRKETLNICKLLTYLCGGCNSFETTGYYKFPDGFFSESPSMEIYCFVDDKKVHDVATALKPLIVDIRLRLGQTNIGMYIDNKYISI